MNTTNDLYRLVAVIRHDVVTCAIDRELLKPVFAAFDGGQVCAVPESIEKRIRHWAGRVAPKQQ